VDYRPYSWPTPEIAAEVLSRAGALSDVIVGNDDEFGFMAGGKDKGLAKARTLAAASASIVVYKMGEKGAITFAEGQEIHTGIYPVAALKPTGAGDSFLAGMLCAIADGHDLKTAVLRGSACAAFVVARPGCAPAMPTPQEITQFLADHTGPTQAT
jgi:5-dehydro-2-deoxygluconokinase